MSFIDRFGKDFSNRPAEPDGLSFDTRLVGLVLGILPILAAAFGLLGCASESNVQRFPDIFHEQVIYARLKNEPVPVPDKTQYDADAHQLQFFIKGFERGWDCVISGALLHGTFGTPVELPTDMREVWSAGWQAGAKIGGDRWMKESLGLREGIGQPDGPRNGSQTNRPETNRTSSAPGSRR